MLETQIIEILNNDYYNNVKPIIDRNTKIALNGYTGNTCKLMSDILLKKNNFSKDGLNILMSDMNLIRKCIKLTKLPIPLTVYHGTSKDYLNTYPLEQGFYKMSTLMSTSLDIEVAFNFMTHYNDNGLILQIDLPINYPALWINPISKHGNEKELILLDNTRFDIINYEELEKNEFLKYMKIYSKPHSNPNLTI